MQAGGESRGLQLLLLLGILNAQQGGWENEGGTGGGGGGGLCRTTWLARLLGIISSPGGGAGSWVDQQHKEPISGASSPTFCYSASAVRFLPKHIHNLITSHHRTDLCDQHATPGRSQRPQLLLGPSTACPPCCSQRAPVSTRVGSPAARSPPRLLPPWGQRPSPPHTPHGPARPPPPTLISFLPLAPSAPTNPRTLACAVFQIP